MKIILNLALYICVAFQTNNLQNSNINIQQNSKESNTLIRFKTYFNLEQFDSIPTLFEPEKKYMWEKEKLYRLFVQAGKIETINRIPENNGFKGVFENKKIGAYLIITLTEKSLIDEIKVEN